jgi:hypothetical protein
MTLLEVVLALSVASALFVASSFWIREAAVTKSKTREPLRFESAAAALFQQIQDALLVGDGADPKKPHIQVVGNELSIATRVHGPATLRYRFEPSRERVMLRTEATGRTRPTESTCLGNVAFWEVTLDTKAGILGIAATSKDGGTYRRRIRLP